MLLESIFIIPSFPHNAGRRLETNKMSAIEKIPMEPVTKVNTEQVDQNKLAMEIVNKTTAQILPLVFSEIEKRAETILAKAQALAEGTQVCVAIKIDDEPMKKLKREAHDQLAHVVAMLKTGLTPMLVGPAGCGKTMLAEQVSEALGLPFGHLCFTAGTSETWLLGRQTPNGFIIAQFAEKYKKGGVFLADEFDAADPNVTLVLNTALANGHLYNPINGENIKRHVDFHFIAACNTFGKGGDAQYTGRNRLDAATLDRFTVVEVGYNERIEKSILPDEDLRKTLQGIRAALVKRNSSETVSYRAFDKAARLKAIGYTKDVILKTLTASWPKNLLKEIGY